MDLGIRGCNALLVGASDGLGLASARRLAEAGCRLQLAARRAAPLEAAAAALRDEYGGEVTTTPCDLASSDQRAALIDPDGPGPDILVISGGWPDIPAGPVTLTMEDWRASLDLMLLAAIDLVGRALPGMRARGFGRVVVVTSRLIKEPEYSLVMPAVARVGLTVWLKAVSREVAREGVTVNSLLPGVFGTDRQLAWLTELVEASGRTEAEVLAERTARTPAGRFGKPDEFGSTCAFLCSRQAGFLTGQAIVVDGGADGGIW